MNDEERVLELAKTFGQIARALQAAPDAQATVQRICELATETIQHCEHAGLTVVAHGKATSPASSDHVPSVVDAIQSETGEGPCIDAITEHELFHVGCLSEERRWPKFARRAFDETGVESVLAFRLFVEHDAIGALNLYSTSRDAFDDHDMAIGAVFAAHAAVAYSNSRTIEALEQGMQSRQIIGEAVGILMARQNVNDAEAFDMLKRASQRMNVKLRLVAEQLVGRTIADAPGEQSPPSQ